MTLYCPNCGYPMYCGCNACKDKVPEGFKPEIYTDTEEGYRIIHCANWGFGEGEDFWLELSGRIWQWYNRCKEND